MLRYLNFRRILGFAILVASAATLAVIIRYFIDSAGKDKKPLSHSLATDISMKSLHFTESHQNRKKWELFARNGTYDKSKEQASLEDIRFIVERTDANGPVTLTAQHGDYLQTARIVQLNGDVHARTDDGITFESPCIKYDSEQQTLSTDDKVRLTDAGLQVEGVGMDVFVDKQEAMIRTKVEATVYPGKRRK